MKTSLRKSAVAGHFYSMYTWAVLLWFVSGRWQEDNQ